MSAVRVFLGNSLIIDDLTTDDSGLYKCSINSEDKKIFKINVNLTENEPDQEYQDPSEDSNYEDEVISQDYPNSDEPISSDQENDETEKKKFLGSPLL